MPGCDNRRISPRVFLMLIVAAAPLACAAPETGQQPRNPFVGTWATANNDVIAIRQDTIVQSGPKDNGTALDKAACGGTFSFTYGSRSREALTALLPRQPGLSRTLSDLLVAPTYPVAELECDRGDQTYVLLNDRQLVAIYRDGDIGAIERLARR